MVVYIMVFELFAFLINKDVGLKIHLEIYVDVSTVENWLFCLTEQSVNYSLYVKQI